MKKREFNDDIVLDINKVQANKSIITIREIIKESKIKNKEKLRPEILEDERQMIKLLKPTNYLMIDKEISRYIGLEHSAYLSHILFRSYFFEKDYEHKDEYVQIGSKDFEINTCLTKQRQTVISKNLVALELIKMKFMKIGLTNVLGKAFSVDSENIYALKLGKIGKPVFRGLFSKK